MAGHVGAAHGTLVLDLQPGEEAVQVDQGRSFLATLDLFQRMFVELFKANDTGIVRFNS